jgi:O-acetyl-ADP-ribose deacetylase
MNFLSGRVMALRGDITQQRVSCIVNAGNRTLLGGGGVDGAIHRAGGPAILEACRELRRNQYPEGLPTGEAVLTTAGQLPAQYVIHTVGPIYGSHDGREAELLAACYRNSLALAAPHHCRTIAFPAISTGAFGYPREDAAVICSAAISEFLAMDSVIEEVRLVFFDEMDLAVFVEYHRFTA